jgi:hypothetical protein
MSDPWLSRKLLGKLIGANFNVTTDQAIVLTPNCVPMEFLVTNASISLTTAAGGIYTAAAKGGVAIVAATQVYSNLTIATRAVLLTIAQLMNAVAGTAATPAQIFFSLTTGQGAAATADIYVFGLDLA